MQTVCGTNSQLEQSGIIAALASYRHQIFIERLGWELPQAQDGVERDQYDRPDTLYVVGTDEEGRVCGCGRLLPTTQPYMLDEIFPQLMGGMPRPHTNEVWELSRFAAFTVGEPGVTADVAWSNTCGVLAAAVKLAASHGAERLITVSPMGIERLLRRMGVHSHRVAAPCMIDGKPIVAMWIEINEKTCGALNVEAPKRAMLAH
jgi:N-acyl-L-homoserine lactone synthetase